MRVRMAVFCAQVLAASSASVVGNEDIIGNPYTVTGNNNIIFSQVSNTAKEGAPLLALTLVIDSLNESGSNFHIEVENHEGPQVSIQQYIYGARQINDGVIFPEDRRPIVPAAAGITIPGKMPTGIALSMTPLDVLLIYKTPQRTFGSAYRFFVDQSVKPLERFSPVSWREGGNLFDIEKELQ